MGVDTARYSAVLAGCYIATDADAVDRAALEKVIDRLNALPGRAGSSSRWSKIP